MTPADRQHNQMKVEGLAIPWLQHEHKSGQAMKAHLVIAPELEQIFTKLYELPDILRGLEARVRALEETPILLGEAAIPLAEVGDHVRQMSNIIAPFAKNGEPEAQR